MIMMICSTAWLQCNMITSHFKLKLKNISRYNCIWIKFVTLFRPKRH
ncbi:hypothetical protein X975_25156, partial [Stegodyphus mimosarum]